MQQYEADQTSTFWQNVIIFEKDFCFHLFGHFSEFHFWGPAQGGPLGPP